MKMNDKDLLVVVENRPENLLIVDTDDLVKFVRGKSAADLRCIVLAELVARWCLSSNHALSSELADILGGFWRQFVDWFQVERLWAEGKSLPESSERWDEPLQFKGFVAVLRRRISRLFAVSGFIPVFNDVGAWFVPFELESGVSGARWSDGAEISAWNEPVSKALEGTASCGIRLQLRQGPEILASVKGNSLMLPVRMAAVRGDCLPDYDVLRVIATGAFDEKFRLADVDVKPKLEAMKHQFSDAVLFGPDVPGEIDCKEKRFFRLDCGMGESAVFMQMRNAMERMPGCVCMSRDYALRRLPDMAALVDRENFRRWNDVAAQLEGMKDSVFSRRDPDMWLEFSSLLGIALCHAGRTEDSKRCVREALSFARKHGFTAKALRLQVTMEVNAQDGGDVDEYRTLTEGIEKELESFDGPEKDDLLMRFHGTAAQMNAFCALYGIAGFSAEAAEEHAEKAVDIAQKIASSAPADCKDEAESNLMQDLNYRHLVFAILKPGTPEEEEAFKDAKRQIAELSKESARNNRYHQMRQKSLALLNAWRKDGKVPAVDSLSCLRLPSDACEWMIAANRRHLGALAVAAGDVAEAELCFREGERAMPFSGCEEPVLASIRLALLAQAACSMSSCGKDTEAARYTALAEEVFSVFGKSRLFNVIHADQWMEALHGKVDPRALPAFYY